MALATVAVNGPVLLVLSLETPLRTLFMGTR